MENKVYALVDCNNFYVSCERVFQPRLRNRPVVVLSNNDGCIVSRSNEVKMMGIERGVPLFRCEPQVRRHGIHVFSSNYTLYGDMSQRVTEVLSRFTPSLEVYSIDEAFLELTNNVWRDEPEYIRGIKDTVEKWTGIPVSIGVGTTKTLAKIANMIAKKNNSFHGVVNLARESEVDAVLRTVPVEKVWGIGHAFTRLLRNNGITTAYQLKYMDDIWVRKHLLLTGLATVKELRGISCIDLEQAAPVRKSIVCSRSFGRSVQEFDELAEAVASYTARAAQKLRVSRLAASFIQVFVTTSRFHSKSYYSRASSSQLSYPTLYTPRLINFAHKNLRKIFQAGYNYKKAGVLLADFTPACQWQYSLLHNHTHEKRCRRLAAALDQINDKWGTGTLCYAAEGIGKSWKMRQARRSSRFTTHWQELPVVSASFPRGYCARKQELRDEHKEPSMKFRV